MQRCRWTARSGLRESGREKLKSRQFCEPSAQHNNIGLVVSHCYVIRVKLEAKKNQIIVCVCRKLHRECTKEVGRFRAAETGESAVRLARAGDARDGLQIGDEEDVVPVLQEMLHLCGDGAADLEDEPSAGTESGVSLRNEAGDDFEAGGSGEDGVARFELADFELDLIFFGFADVGRIGDDEIESFREQAGEEIGLVEADAIFELMAGGVGAGDFEGDGGNVGGVDFCLREFFGQGEGDAAGAGADVGDVEVGRVGVFERGRVGGGDVDRVGGQECPPHICGLLSCWFHLCAG